ncbi:Hypothetical predicted protein, partial [Mytilus galloprovincialis]
MKQELYGYDIKKVTEEFGSTTKAITQALTQVELESTKKQLKQVKEELESTRNKLQQAQVALDSTREQINVLEKDNARRDDIDPVRADLNASRDELHAILKGNAAGKHYNMGGSGANLLCLPKNPEWKEYTEGDSSTWTGKLFGVEYDI